MHVKLGHSDGEWHRLMLDRHPNRGSWRTQSIQGARTACGIVITQGYYAMREESYAGRLCKNGCFTPAEHQVAVEMKEAEAADEFARAEQRERERIEMERERKESRARAQQRLDAAARRFRTMETQPIPKVDVPDDVPDEEPDDPDKQ